MSDDNHPLDTAEGVIKGCLLGVAIWLMVIIIGFGLYKLFT